MSNGYVRKLQDGRKHQEHRLVMELHLNRKLKPDEDVHHINGDKADNRIENLAVMEHGAHTAHHRRKHPKAIACARCGTEFTSDDHAGRVKYCGRACYDDSQRVPQTIRDTVKKMRVTGSKYSEICRATGLSQASVSRIVNS